MKQNKNCKYGSTCRRQHNGTCHFKHLNQEKTYKYEHSHKEKTHRRQRSRSREIQRNKEEKKHESHRRKHSQSHRNKRENEKKEKSPQIEYKHKVTQNKPQKPQKPQKQPIQHFAKAQKVPINKLIHQKLFEKFCLSYHLENRCNDKENCDKLHSFMFKDHTFIRRKIFFQSVKITANSKFCNSVHEEAIEYIIKTDKQLCSYHYRPCINQFKEDNHAQLELSKSPKKEYFASEGPILYFSYQNQLSSFYDIYYYDLKSNRSYEVKSAHLSEVTGAAKFQQDKIITVSLDGTLKVWNLDHEELTLKYDKPISEEFSQLYSSKDKNKELYFIEKVKYYEKELICVGSQESKLLVFGNQTPIGFKQITVSQNQLKILKIKQINKNSQLFQILVLAESKTKSFIYKLKTDGVKEQKTQKIVQIEHSEQKRINTFEIHGDFLIVSYGSQLIFYSLDSPGTILGGITHTNNIKNLSISTYELKQTAVQFNVMAVLQGASETKKEGTLSLYFLQ